MYSYLSLSTETARHKSHGRKTVAVHRLNVMHRCILYPRILNRFFSFVPFGFYFPRAELKLSVQKFGQNSLKFIQLKAEKKKRTKYIFIRHGKRKEVDDNCLCVRVDERIIF